MRRLLPLFLITSALAGCGGIPVATDVPALAPPASSTAQSLAGERDTVGTAQELLPAADRLARQWRPRARLLQLDGVHISENGRNDHPFEAVWTFTYEEAGNPVTVLKVSFDSGQTEPSADEVGRSGAYSDRDVDAAGWHIDSPRVLSIAISHGVQWFPVDKMRLSYFADRLAWQVRSNEDYVALDAGTGQVFNPVKGGTL